MELDIRPCRSEDLSHPCVAPLTWEAISERYPILCGWSEGRFVGAVRLMVGRSRPPAAEDYVCVDPRQQGNGFGRRLVAAIVKKASELGYERVTARIPKSNSRSLRCHQAAGFQCVREEDGECVYERATARID